MTEAKNPSAKQAQSKRSGGIPAGVVILLLFCVAIAAGGAIYYLASSILDEGAPVENRVAKVTESPSQSSSQPKSVGPTLAPEKAKAWSNYYAGLFKAGKQAAQGGLTAVSGEGGSAAEPDFPDFGADSGLHTHEEPAAESEAEAAASLDSPADEAVREDGSASMHYVQLGEDWQGYGATVYKSEGDPDKFAELAQEEFKKAKLNQKDLELLASFDLTNDVVDLEGREVLGKFARLLYYAKQLGKEAAVEVLLERVHPSIRSAVNANPELSLSGTEPAAEEQALTVVENEEQVQQVDTIPSVDTELPQAVEPTAIPVQDFERDFERGRLAANRGDFVSAMLIWKPLAEKGYAKAQTAVGRMHARGDGVSRNFNEAFRWFFAAAEQGDDLAQLNLGKMYLRGDGVAKNKETAKRYLELAAARGNKEAKALLR